VDEPLAFAKAIGPWKCPTIRVLCLYNWRFQKHWAEQSKLKQFPSFQLVKKKLFIKRTSTHSTQFLPIRSKNGPHFRHFFCSIFLIVKIVFCFPFSITFQGSRKLL
jgi:hypothetical protein